MRLTSAAPAVVMLALSATMVANTLPMGVWSRFTAGPAFFPLVIATVTTVLAVLLLVQALRGDAADAGWPDRSALRTVGLVYGALLAFLLLAPVLGMLSTSAALLAFVMIVALRQPLAGSLVAVAVTTGLVHIIFIRWLAIPLPSGVLGF